MGITFGSDIRGRGPGGEVVLKDRGHTVVKLISSVLVCRGLSKRVLASCAHVGAIVSSGVAGSGLRSSHSHVLSLSKCGKRSKRPFSRITLLPRSRTKWASCCRGCGFHLDPSYRGCWKT